MKPNFICITVLVLHLALLWPGPAHAQPVLGSRQDLFTEDTPLRLTLVFDIRSMLKNKMNPDYQTATLQYKDADSSLRELQIRVKPRGEFRRSYCAFPPLKLDFSKVPDADSGLKQLEDLKLVTHCKNSTLYEQYLLREYLVYKAYNLITPQSFRARLVEINYVDTDTARPAIRRYGFLIENIADMAERNGTHVLKAEGVTQCQVNPDAMTRLAIFQYMIGNLDWSVPANHNVRLLAPSPRSNWTTPVPVAYDFDYCGLVSTSYSAPPEAFSDLRSVQERKFMGRCCAMTNIEQHAGLFIEKKAEILGLFENNTLLDERYRKQTVRFLNQFFAIIEDPRTVKSQLVHKCMD